MRTQHISFLFPTEIFQSGVLTGMQIGENLESMFNFLCLQSHTMLSCQGDNRDNREALLKLQNDKLKISEWNSLI